MSEEMTTAAVPGGTAETGRYLLVLADELLGDAEAGLAAVREVAGTAEVGSTAGGAALDTGQLGAGTVYFAELGIAVVGPGAVGTGADPGAVRDRAATDPRVLAVEPERTVHLRAGGQLGAEYLRGYRDAAAHLYDQAVAASEEPGTGEAFVDTATLTWGLRATGVPGTTADGAGVLVAVLDTGIDLAHPDFAGRAIVTESFVDGETVQDGNGHGTHCAGTACGPSAPVGDPRRYGVAPAAGLLVGKVLGDAGSGSDAGVLAGMSWAIAQGAAIVSMSLGSDVREVSTTYETVGRRALAAGTLIIAAAGNNADREGGDPGFVGVPANSPSIMAVGAVDQSLAVAPFSAASNPVDGGQVDIAAPGVGVYSSWPLPTTYNSISGTSMATPHVAGLAALWAQTTGATGAALWSEVTRSARRLPLPATDVGSGLAQAPAAEPPVPGVRR